VAVPFSEVALDVANTFDPEGSLTRAGVGEEAGHIARESHDTVMAAYIDMRSVENPLLGQAAVHFGNDLAIPLLLSRAAGVFGFIRIIVDRGRGWRRGVCQVKGLMGLLCIEITRPCPQEERVNGNEL